MDKWLRFFLFAAAILLLLLPSPAFAQQCTPLEEAVISVNEARYADALELLKPLAENGDADAQNILGGLYIQGWGVARDFDRARYWFEESAGQGNPMGCYNLGGMYANGIGVEQDCTKALDLVRRPAEAGDPIGQVNLGALYADGSTCTPRDFGEALRWFRSAADQGDPLGQHSLGAMYANGQGVGQDYAAAMRWYRMAADQGFADSQAILGWMYEFGEGVEPDIERAVEWYRRAAAQGDARAQQRLQAIETDGEAAQNKLLATYMAAPAVALAMEYNRVETVFMMIDVATELHVGDLVISDDNREQMRAGFIEMQQAMREAMRQRGALELGGTYALEATQPCERLPSMWTEGVAGSYLGEAEIRQAGHEFTIVQEVLADGGQVLEIPGIVVEDVIVFSDMMNSDFVFVGHADSGTIVVRPDTEFILSGWPDWERAPKRSDLDRCRITLTRQ
jgi:TPR repeat protein